VLSFVTSSLSYYPYFVDPSNLLSEFFSWFRIIGGPVGGFGFLDSDLFGEVRLINYEGLYLSLPPPLLSLPLLVLPPSLPLDNNFI